MNDDDKIPSPTCCDDSRQFGVVTLWISAGGEASWCARPYRGHPSMVHPVRNCPFCGVRLGREHVPMENR